MSNIVPFQFESQDIRTITNERGEPWFVLRDVLDATQSKTTVTAATDAINQGLGDGFASDIPILDPLGREQVVRVIAEAAVTRIAREAPAFTPGRDSAPRKARSDAGWVDIDIPL